MKYVNSLKYMNSFKPAADSADISIKRILELCDALGRVNIGNKVIYLPSGKLGYAAAIMLESVIMHAGYRVGRITSAFGTDSRSAVYINGDRASIEDYNLAVSELKAAVLRDQSQSYYKEETVYVMSLLLCKMCACDYVILQGMSGGEHDLASLCAPYDIVVVPTVCADDSVSEPLFNAIKRGTREVISATQKKSVYDLISKACFTCGARLTFTSSSSFYTEALSGIERKFQYGDRGGYTVKSPSIAISECAMLAIESALAIRRSGIKLPWMSITEGLAAVSGTGCFEIISASPLVLLDSAENEHELAFFLSTVETVLSKEALGGMAVCIPSSAERLCSMLEKYSPSKLIIVGGESNNTCSRVVCKNCRDAAKYVMQNMKDGTDTVCFGSVPFGSELKGEIIKLMC